MERNERRAVPPAKGDLAPCACLERLRQFAVVGRATIFRLLDAFRGESDFSTRGTVSSTMSASTMQMLTSWMAAKATRFRNIG